MLGVLNHSHGTFQPITCEVNILRVKLFSHLYILWRSTVLAVAPPLELPMANAVPSTPKSKSRLPPCLDTQLRHPLTTQSQYLSGDLTEGRRAVINDLKKYRQVPYEQLVRSRFHILPEDGKIAEIHGELKANGLITQDDKQWSAFVKKPSVNESVETSVFKPLYPIISKIFEQVPDSSFYFVMAPAETPCSTRRNTSRPDAFIRLKTSYRPDKKTHWFDIAVPFEFKKSNNDSDKHDVRRNYLT